MGTSRGGSVDRSTSFAPPKRSRSKYIISEVSNRSAWPARFFSDTSRVKASFQTTVAGVVWE